VRPNIVVLMVDDLDEVSFQQASRAGLLPHLGRLFDRGTEFRESFVTESLCCPSRATYLTGLYPHNHGVVRNSGPRGGFDDFMRAHGDDNLAVWMQGAGYRTAHLGKFLNGYSDGTFVPSGWDEWQALVDRTTYCMYGYDLSNNGDPVRDEGQHLRIPLLQLRLLAGAANELLQPTNQVVFAQAALRHPHLRASAVLALHWAPLPDFFACGQYWIQ